MIPDSHAHLDLIDRDPGEVVSSARAAGVSPIITIGINLDSSGSAVRLAALRDTVYAAVGIHPNDTSNLGPEDMEALERLARSSDRVVAIGETGLDYYRDRSPAGTQKKAFREHIRLAGDLGKALVVHDREAHADTLEILGDEDTGFPVIMHCFSGDERMLAECENRGYYISFAGPLTFKKSESTRRLASLAPLDRLLVETDSPFLSPEPYRGKPNLPERARLVAVELAHVRLLLPDEMEAVLADNTARAFGIQTVRG
ncbi:MAG: TatD family hydrolase [Actinobacteria bacterium]|nr:TatD family hydrolase [Actinomycetota bacterium]